MKKIKLLVGILVFVAAFGLASCGEEEHKPSEENPPVVVPPVDDSFEVSFDTDGGSQVTAIKMQEAGKVSKPSDPTKDKHIFAGWYKDAEKKTLWDFASDVATKKTTIYAKWEKIVTCMEANKLCEPEGYKSTDRVWIRGTVETISNPTYGEMTISDSTGTLYVYGTYSADGVKRYSELEDKPYAGDEVLLYGLLENFKGSAELKSAWIKEFNHKQVEFNEADYVEASISKARESKKGDKVKVTGVVAKITYANGMIPSGFYLVDSTDSIYVYDDQLAPRVEIGNKITLAAEKDLWILDKEQDNASKFGYAGCCQLTKGHLLKNDEKTNAFDKSWIKETSIKEIMNTSVKENITTTIYKVNALVKKSEGTGFVNYLFLDLDGTTGSYTYTQCNGKDFSWLDEFDGKICTVYLSVINAKSVAAGCTWRFLPIEVKDEEFKFSLADAPKFAIEYFVLDQFLSTYTSDPAIELITKVSSDLLKLSDIKIEYTSSDPSVISFDSEGTKLIMHAKDEGKATITIKASYQGYELKKNLEVEYKVPVIPKSIHVGEAIAMNLFDEEGILVPTEVTVRGIVGPSLVNKVGFYLIDSTGVIAVTMNSEVISTLSMGQEVIVKGTRTLFGREGDYYGQSVLLDCELLLNLMGSSEYSKETFDSTKKIEDLIELSTKEDHTTQVYVVEAKIEFVDNKNFSNLYLVSLTDPSKKLLLYCSSATSQYAWMRKYNNETVTIELALCNWNKKKPFKACILSVTTQDDQTEYNTLNFVK